MEKYLNKMTKKELLKIISKMKKAELVTVIANNSNKVGGSNEIIIKETKNAVRTPITYDQRRNNKKNHNNAMANNNLYNKMYELEIK